MGWTRITVYEPFDTKAHIVMKGNTIKVLGNNAKLIQACLRIKDVIYKYIMAFAMLDDAMDIRFDNESVPLQALYFEDGSVFDYELKKHIITERK